MHLGHVRDAARRHQTTAQRLRAALSAAAAGMEWSLLEVWEAPSLRKLLSQAGLFGQNPVKPGCLMKYTFVAYFLELCEGRSSAPLRCFFLPLWLWIHSF